MNIFYKLKQSSIDFVKKEMGIEVTILYGVLPPYKSNGSKYKVLREMQEKGFRIYTTFMMCNHKLLENEKHIVESLRLQKERLNNQEEDIRKKEEIIEMKKLIVIEETFEYVRFDFFMFVKVK